MTDVNNREAKLQDKRSRNKIIHVQGLSKDIRSIGMSTGDCVE
jgi:hypothetical protein